MQLPRFATSTPTLTSVVQVAEQAPSSGLRSGHEAVSVSEILISSTPMAPRPTKFTLIEPSSPRLHLPMLLVQVRAVTVGLPPHGQVKVWSFFESIA